MLQPYQSPTDVMQSTLTNDKTTTKHELDCEVMEGVLDCVQQHCLDVRFTIPTDTSNEQVTDICGVHIINWAGAIIANKTGLSGMNADKLCQLMESMVKELSEKSYLIEIKTTRANQESVTEKTIQKGKHLIEAINRAMDCDFWLIEDIVYLAKPLTITEDGETISFVSAKLLEQRPQRLPVEENLWGGLLVGLSVDARDVLLNNNLGVGTTVLKTDSTSTVSDIIGLHIEDCRGHIIKEQYGFEDLNNESLSQAIIDLVQAILIKGYIVEIESVRGMTDPITTRNNVKRNAKHPMQAIDYALTFLLDEVYDELPRYNGCEDMEDVVNQCMAGGEKIMYNANGNIHTVINFTETQCFDEATTRNMV